MGAPSTKTEYSHIVRTPGIVGGEPRIEGHRVRVRDIVAARDLGGLTPEEIAATVLFCAGPGASFMTGCAVTVDGGLSAKGAWAVE